ncbi:DUF411 domain-containing protein [Microbulbifer sp. YPW16]|uniref:DUF411 domain-containing protein n=1 Tax=Microbulbifer sp. YPW16 TaxID=2904242 RepID=UPI001E3509FA|nr:DUF411 domain-containing protein [Microbulbifer sp. YPW16]UHQ55675.1 hypothetical protein LVE68_01415 [Microbulbifer sp. YPW16]
MPFIMRKSAESSVVSPLALVVAVLCLAIVNPTRADDSATEPGRTAEQQQAAVQQPVITVYKHRFCFCCKRWMEHLQGNGMQTPVVNASNDELSELKGKWRIPTGMQGCHTGVFNGEYVFEGHVPARLIRKFLANPPEGSIGLTVPGMPKGSPGMYDGDKFSPYTVYLVMRDGDYRFYARVEQPEAGPEGDAAMTAERAGEVSADAGSPQGGS